MVLIFNLNNLDNSYKNYMAIRYFYNVECEKNFREIIKIILSIFFYFEERSLNS